MKKLLIILGVIIVAVVIYFAIAVDTGVAPLPSAGNNPSPPPVESLPPSPPADNQNTNQSSPPPAGVSKNDTSDWKVYSNAGIEFKYPKSWTLTENLSDHPATFNPVGIIRVSGDGYHLGIDVNSGRGEPLGSLVEILVNGKNIDAVEYIDDKNQAYYLFFFLTSPDNDGYKISARGVWNDKSEILSIKKMMITFFSTVKLI